MIQRNLILLRSTRRFIQRNLFYIGKGKWDNLSLNERLAWQQLGWNKILWEGSSENYPNNIRATWEHLSLEEQGIVTNGLGMNSNGWNSLVKTCLTPEPGIQKVEPSSAISIEKNSNITFKSVSVSVAKTVFSVAQAVAPLGISFYTLIIYHSL